MKSKRCVVCHQSFQPYPQVPNQSYCSARECQRERRRRWQRDKLQTDSDYRDNQSRAQRAWMDRNPDYWREYREAHPDYVERNRDQQRVRAAPSQNPDVAKMDALAPPPPFPSGIYHLRPADMPYLAKMDACTVKITVLSAICPCNEGACKEMT
jgi:hypothetical protein